jgi:hypothetical protein
MEPNPWVARAKKAAVAVAALLVVAYLGGSWHYSNVLARDLLTPASGEPTRDIEVLGVDGGTIALSRTERSERDGVFGVAGEGTYGQVADVVEVGDEEVTRVFREVEGEFAVGDMVALDQYAYLGDPLTALGLPFHEVRVGGELGVLPAWLVDGPADTWVVIVHGKGVNERRQALRLIPMLNEAGYPALVVSYRNDLGAPPAESGRHGWGYPEWRDLEAGLQFADLRGAESFVLVGFSMGGEIVATFLHESEASARRGAPLTDLVRAVVFDSPVLDLEGTVDAEADRRGIPGILTSTAEAIARLRFDLDWRALDQVARADEFDPAVPILLLHGTADSTVPFELSAAFAERVAHATFEPVDGADHVELWNADPARYELLVADFLARVAPVEPTDG